MEILKRGQRIKWKEVDGVTRKSTIEAVNELEQHYCVYFWAGASMYQEHVPFDSVEPLDKNDIMDDLEDLQAKVNDLDLKGSNERELWLRDEVADYILKNFI